MEKTGHAILGDDSAINPETAVGAGEGSQSDRLDEAIFIRNLIQGLKDGKKSRRIERAVDRY